MPHESASRSCREYAYLLWYTMRGHERTLHRKYQIGFLVSECGGKRAKGRCHFRIEKAPLLPLIRNSPWALAESCPGLASEYVCPLDAPPADFSFRGLSSATVACRTNSRVRLLIVQDAGKSKKYKPPHPARYRTRSSSSATMT